MKTGSMLVMVVLTIVALAHALRLALGWQVTVDGTDVPAAVSVVGVLLPLALVVMLWRESRGSARPEALRRDEGDPTGSG